MDPENTQKPDENNHPVAPPPYMPPIEAAPTITPQQQPIDNPTEPVIPTAKTTPMGLNLKSDVPPWAWTAAAVIIVGILGVVGWRVYSVNEANRMIEESNLSNSRSQSVTVNQPEKTTQATSVDNSKLPTTVDLSVANTATVTISDQVWMKYNMNVGTSSVPKALLNDNKVEKDCYNLDDLNCDIYGGLYTWDEAMQYSTTERAQGICPAGFHIPSKDDFSVLINNFGGDRNTNANSMLIFGGSGEFDGRLGGAYFIGVNSSYYEDFGGATYFWTSTLDNTNSDAYTLGLYSGKGDYVGGTNLSPLPKGYNASVRCVKNLPAY
jgi:uncharacterized protein (TIGR02145 family)